MSTRFTFTSEQRQAFLDQGFLRVPGVIPADAAAAMADRIWEALASQIGALPDRPDTWKAQGLVHPPVNFRDLSRAGAFAAVLSPTLRALLDDFFGARGWDATWSKLEPRPLGPVFPTPERAWNVPTRHWHTDGVDPKEWPDTLRLFACVAPLEPGGGATFYVAGSHRAVVRAIGEMRGGEERIGSATVIKRLKAQSPWLADLFSRGPEGPGRIKRFMREGAELEGVPLRVAEMTGQPGDVLLWHPDLMHTYAPCNRLDTPRMAISATYHAKAPPE